MTWISFQKETGRPMALTITTTSPKSFHPRESIQMPPAISTTSTRITVHEAAVFDSSDTGRTLALGGRVVYDPLLCGPRAGHERASSE